MTKKLTLKEAIAKGKLEQFIKENEGETGDKEVFDKAISLMAKADKNVDKKKLDGNNH